MPGYLDVPSAREQRLAHALRCAVVDEIDRRRDLTHIATALAMHVEALKLLLRNPSWELGTAYRAADRLNLAAIDAVDELMSTQTQVSGRPAAGLMR
jgi:hypothetical protein